MVETIISEVIKTNAIPILVLGSSAENILQRIPDEEIEIVTNENWQEGIASSIRMGLQKALDNHPLLEGVIFVVCDQPFVTADLLNELIRQHKKTNASIVASAYAGTLGTPAFFQKQMFHQVLQLTGDSGARRIIQQNMADVISVAFDNGSIDIDTDEDYENMKESF
jgi:molybdenum cofactor cytidylyltransferase